MEERKTDVLVVGGGTGGTAAAIQAARRGINVTLVSEFSWLGGMLTSAGVSAPDGNELAAFQTGIWGQFLQELRKRQPEGLDHAWVSFFTYEPRTGAEIFAEWVRSLPSLNWISGQTPQAVLRKGNRVTAVEFEHYRIHAQIILDGTELGDLLALAEIPHRWGWEWRSQWQEPSAPATASEMTDRYPVQAPTWVFLLQDFGEGAIAPEISAPPIDHPDQFCGTWDGYGAEHFLNYGRLPGNRFMMNFPQKGNDYGEKLDRLIQSSAAKAEFLQEALWHSHSYARFLQTHLGRRYGLAPNAFPSPNSAFALHPYYRESRRLQGMVTIREQDILPASGGQVAALPIDAHHQVDAIALGNYANDHHYPGYDFPLAPKSIRWGGRWTGTPFTIPYRSLIPDAIDNFLACEKNISVSHIANGATRLQPAVLGIGQAAGMAAALCIEKNCQPRELPTRVLQEALLTDRFAPMAIVPLFNLPPEHPEWLQWQRYYLDHPDEYPVDGNCPAAIESFPLSSSAQAFQGVFHRKAEKTYELTLTTPEPLQGTTASLVTLRSPIHQQLTTLSPERQITVWGVFNHAGNWLLVDKLEERAA